MSATAFNPYAFLLNSNSPTASRRVAAPAPKLDLATALSRANGAGIAVAATAQFDVTSCNHDCAILQVKGGNKAKILADIKAAGFECEGTTKYCGQQWYFLNMPGLAFAYASRTAAARAVRDELQAAGYRATCYYAAD